MVLREAQARVLLKGPRGIPVCSQGENLGASVSVEPLGGWGGVWSGIWLITGDSEKQK